MAARARPRSGGALSRRQSRAGHRFFNPELAAAEAYMDGTLSFEDGTDVHAFLTLFSVNRAPLAQYRVQSLLRRGWKMMRRYQQANDVQRNAKKQARSHYDLSTELYRLFLDEGINYSCALYHDEHEPPGTGADQQTRPHRRQAEA
jgi:cyclopropane-fatty-acyl-phospholipid synthase